MKLYEVFLVPDVDPGELLSQETLDATGAQIFTPAEARFIGLEGIPDDPEGRARVLIACRPSDEQYIASRLEGHPAVATFKLHDL